MGGFFAVVALVLMPAGWRTFFHLARRLVRERDRWPWSHLVFVVLLFSLCFAGYRAFVQWRLGRRGTAIFEFLWWPVIPALAVEAFVSRFETKAHRERRNAELTHRAFTGLQAWRESQTPPSDTGAGSAPEPNTTDDPGA